jgi:hypothetical protein
MDSVGFGFISCKELMPDPWALADAVPAALAELVAAAEQLSGTKAQPKKSANKEAAGKPA